MGFVVGAELFNSLQREKKETKRQDGTGSDGAHVAGHVGDAQPIKPSQQETVENGQGSGGNALANLAGILLKGTIAAAGIVNLAM